MLLSALNTPPQIRVAVTRFGGYDRSPQTPRDAFSAMENMSASCYPALSVRPPRGVVTTLSAPGGLTQRAGLIWCDGNQLFYNGAATGLVLSDGGKKQFVSMGAYLIVFPDKKYLNTRDLSEFGTMENTAVTTGTVSLTLCRKDGDPYSDYTVSAAAPESPAPGALRLDTAGTTPVLRQYDAASAG